ncbi:tetrahydromethanopterin S-methyltransferase subunit F [Candidatus Methanosphaera massiliense]|jgi:tetrahydromethanopterin S-methyltransferase subunit F|uniref:tetrahydromethanopterin S-methyltransferase subunit F n=1 Tax=Methanosphaera TaxID=2316 RepID=UPI0023805DAD|nr:tetrahydromethanopterin S-methyltransferase subunit F [Candidatus Methanosphaera massiliense]MDD6285261.1 tetrahydromethanopterin S-methyltransferase subunit F [Methanobacteriaceae archaeon]MDE4078267.1 tetrahydromethanopterin S-methyltransferase subunit F [Candidatus Methanosphaera massiliense]MDY2745192.1 tetrahydromethanopterin S-methyltransferase subunit F [Methanosphaera sp.]
MKKTMNNIGELVDSIEYRAQLIGRNQRLISGVESTRISGILIGFICTLIIVGIPILYYSGGF